MCGALLLLQGAPSHRQRLLLPLQRAHREQRLPLRRQQPPPEQHLLRAEPLPYPLQLLLDELALRAERDGLTWLGLRLGLGLG